MGRVILVGSSLDEGSRQIRVGVEVANPPTERYPEGRFKPGGPVTIVID